MDTTQLTLILLAINAFTYLLYWLDKLRAKRQGERIPENILLLFALAGGSPAAYVAMRQFRHKTKKSSFRTQFWCILALQTAGLIYYFLP